MALPAIPSADRPDYRTVERNICGLIARDPDRVLRATDVVAELDGVDLVDVLPALARLTYNGHLERIAPGRYQWPGTPRPVD